jgi:hypothetical protein
MHTPALHDPVTYQARLLMLISIFLRALIA